MPESRLRFTVAEWMVIVAVFALALARCTWVLRHQGSDWLGVEGILWLAIGGAAVTWFQIRPIPVGTTEGTRRSRPSNHNPSKSIAPPPHSAKADP
jgi:hypothetical protein